jgi:hypothetical protein
MVYLVGLKIIITCNKKTRTLSNFVKILIAKVYSSMKPIQVIIRSRKYIKICIEKNELDAKPSRHSIFPLFHSPMDNLLVG